MKPKKYFILCLFFILFLSFWAIKPFFHLGFFPIHDDTQIVRVQQIAQALKDGQFPVRWVADLGYGFGYPIFNFYAPLPYYIGAVFNLIGFDVLLATKLMMILGILLSGVFMYLLAREFWGEMGGILSGLFYIYAPYHAVDIYVRGAVAEFWAMVFLPLAFLGIYQIFQKNHWGIVIASLGFAGVILSHSLTAMMAVPFILLGILVLFIFSKAKKYFILHTLYFILLFLGLSAFYWLPALFEMNFTKVFGQLGGGADFRDHFVFLDQLWASPWGFAGSAPGRLDGMSFMIGKLHIIFAAFSIITCFYFWKKYRRQSLAILLATGFCLLATGLTNQLSQPIWDAIPPMAFIQYPWRFLVFTAFAASFMVGAVVLWFRKKTRLSWIGGIIIIGALLFLNTKYFLPQMYLDVSAKDYTSEENIKWKTSKISDEYLPRDFPTPQNRNEVAWEKVAVLEGEAEIKDLKLKSYQYTFEAVIKSDTQILINTAYFPGWKLWVDGKETDFSLDNGKIRFSLPAGDYQISVRLTNTPIRTVSNLISLVSWVGLGAFMLKYSYGRD